MPNLNNLAQKFEKRKPFTNLTETNRSGLLSVRREDIFHREEIKASFGYVAVGITISLAIVGGAYVIGKQLLK